MSERVPRPGDAGEIMQIQLYRSMDSVRKMRMLFEMFEFALRRRGWARGIVIQTGATSKRKLKRAG
jgi:hypothetical protein